MPAGLRIYDAQGNVIGDYTSSYGRFIGMIDTAAYPGNSFTDARLASGRPWLIKMFKHNDVSPTTACPINIAASGTTISWQISNPGSRKDCWLIYGVY